MDKMKIVYRDGFPALSSVLKLVKLAGLQINSPGSYRYSHSIHWGRQSKEKEGVDRLLDLLKQHQVEVKNWRYADPEQAITGNIWFKQLTP